MASKIVKIQNFEGPFDLLLSLVLKKRIDISSLTICDIADQYLAEVSKMVILDIETASDFMLVAATLIEIKANSLLPKPIDLDLEDDTELSSFAAKELLIAKLIRYKQFKNVSIFVEEKTRENTKTFSRKCKIDKNLKSFVPDYLANTDIVDFAHLACEQLGRKDKYLLKSSHIAKPKLDLETFAETIISRCKVERKVRFSQLVKSAPRREIIVVTMLAILELYKRNKIDIMQVDSFGDIDIVTM